MSLTPNDTREQRRRDRLAKSLKLQAVPNLKDPRLVRRATQVLDFAYDLQIVPHGRRAMRATELYKITGTPRPGAKTDPAGYFKTLFRQLGSYSKGSEFKDASTYVYMAIPHRVTRLAEAIGYKDGLVRAAHRKGWSFLNAPGPRSELRRTGDRVYPWWALMQRDVRVELFVAELGQGYDYDIEAAKPTVTLQAWKKQFPTAPTLKTWERLVADRKTFRVTLADEVGITVEQAKDVCQTVLNGGWASPVKKNGICEAIGEAATRRLMESSIYQNLRADFKTFWTVLKESGTVPEILSAGEAGSLFYNRIEDEIMSVVAEELKTQDVWFIHDGFMTKDKIHKARIEEAIFFRTGYDVHLEETDLCKSVGL